MLCPMKICFTWTKTILIYSLYLLKTVLKRLISMKSKTLPRLTFPVKKRSLTIIFYLKDVSARLVNVLDYIALVFRQMASVVQAADVLIVLTTMTILRSESSLLRRPFR